MSVFLNFVAARYCCCHVSRDPGIGKMGRDCIP